MADYPSLAISADSDFAPRGGLLTDMAEDGTQRTRSLYASTNYEFTLLHQALTSTERTTLLAHYAAHKALTFNYVSPWSETYTMRYLDEPQGKPRPSGLWDFVTKLTGKKV